MDMGLVKQSAAPAEFNLHGEALLLYPLRNMDWGRIEQWMRTQIINAAKEAIADVDTFGTKQFILKTAHQEAAKISIASCFLSSAARRKMINARRKMTKSPAKLSDEQTDEQPKSLEEIEEQPLAFLHTFEGMLRIVHLALRDGPGRNGRPKYELFELDEIIGQDFVALSEMYGVVFSLSFPSDEEGEPAKNSQAAAATPESKK